VPSSRGRQARMSAACGARRSPRATGAAVVGHCQSSITSHQRRLCRHRTKSRGGRDQAAGGEWPPLLARRRYQPRSSRHAPQFGKQGGNRCAALLAASSLRRPYPNNAAATPGGMAAAPRRRDSSRSCRAAAVEGSLLAMLQTLQQSGLAEPPRRRRHSAPRLGLPRREVNRKETISPRR